MTTKELGYAHKIKFALDESLDNLPLATTDRLAAARKQALARKKPHAPLQALATRRALAGAAGGFFGAPPAPGASWLGRMGTLLPLIALVAGLVGLYLDEQQQRITDLAEIDAMVLTDELPLSAYLDHGFNAYLSRQAD